MPRIDEIKSNGIFSLLAKDFRQHQFRLRQGFKGDRWYALLIEPPRTESSLMCIDPKMNGRSETASSHEKDHFGQDRRQDHAEEQ
jgi:hypothetical protein